MGPPAMSMTATRCNVCGGERFVAGPGGRTSRTGRSPLCAECKSLERDRVLNEVWRAVPARELEGRCLVLGNLMWRSDARFEDCVRLPASADLERKVAPSKGGYDWIVCQYVLPFVADDRALVRRLDGLLSDEGVLVIMAPSTATRAETEEWSAPRVELGGAWRLYGRDLSSRFERELGGAFEEVRLEDPVTAEVDSVFLYSRSGVRLRWLRDLLAKQAERECSICQCRVFKPAPGERLAAGSKLPPQCTQCGSLERHRIVRAVWKALPRSFLGSRRCLQFSADPAVLGNWFADWEVSIYGKRNSMDIQSLPRQDGAYDVVICNHVLEHIEDDRQAFREVLRVLSPRGFFQFSVPAPIHRLETEDWGYPKPELHLHYRVYGRDLLARFRAVDDHARSLVARGCDPVTGVEDLVYFWARSDAVIAELAGFLTAAGVSLVRDDVASAS